MITPPYSISGQIPVIPTQPSLIAVAKGEGASRLPRLATASQDGLTAPTSPLRVLIVEDEAIIAMDLEMTIEDLGAEVVGMAANATDAARLARALRPDCITMDINICGDRDGVSVAIEIYETLGIRSIFVSAYGDPGTKARAQAAHPFGWIAKPVSLPDLAVALSKVLEER